MLALIISDNVSVALSRFGKEYDAWQVFPALLHASVVSDTDDGAVNSADLIGECVRSFRLHKMAHGTLNTGQLGPTLESFAVQLSSVLVQLRSAVGASKLRFAQTQSLPMTRVCEVKNDGRK